MLCLCCVGVVRVAICVRVIVCDVLVLRLLYLCCVFAFVCLWCLLCVFLGFVRVVVVFVFA